ncbi:MAG: surface lipoprotein assembly modifier [Pseudomonadota bacterium]
MRILAAIAVCISLSFALSSVRAEASSVNTQIASVSTADLFDAVSRQDWPRAKAVARAIDAAEDHGDLMAAYAMAAKLTSQGECKLALKMSEVIIKMSPLFLPAYDLAAACLIETDREAAAAKLYRSAANTVGKGADYDLLVDRANAIDPMRKLRFSVDADIAPSTNLNRGTKEDGVGNFTISDSAKEKSGVLAHVAIEAEKPVFVNERLRAAVSLRVGASYNTITGGYVPSVRTAFSATRILNAKTILEFKPYVEVGFAETDYLYTRPGASVSVRRQVSPGLVVAAKAEASYYLFDDGQRDGIAASVSVDTSKTLSPNDRLNTKLWASVQERDYEPMNNVAVGGEIEIEHRFSKGAVEGLITSAAVGGHYRWHDRNAALQNERQEDYAAFARLGISHQKVKLGKVRPELTYTATKQWSNDAFSRFDAHDVGIRFKATF